MKEEGIYTDEYEDADYVLVPGDREETYEVALRAFKDNKRIIHLWAGDVTSSWETHNDVYRHSITLMSAIQLCTNDTAKERVKSLCKSVNKIYMTTTVGNVMLDNIELDESIVPTDDYNLILYNPPTTLSRDKIYEEINQISGIISKDNIHDIWIEPNGDKSSDIVFPFQNQKSLPRKQFLGLMKRCNKFITNSSCQYYEAPSLLKPEQIISIGKRNSDRESKESDMTIPNASENIMKVLRSLNG